MKSRAGRQLSGTYRLSRPGQPNRKRGLMSSTSPQSAPRAGRRRRHRTAVIAVLGAGPGLVRLVRGRPGNRPAPGSQPAVGVTRLAVPGNVTLLQVSTSLLGVHKWYRQMQNGYPVVGGLYAQHIDDPRTGEGPGHRVGRPGQGLAPAYAPGPSSLRPAAIAAATAYTKGHPITLVQPSLWVLPGRQRRGWSGRSPR